MDSHARSHRGGCPALAAGRRNSTSARSVVVAVLPTRGPPQIVPSSWRKTPLRAGGIVSVRIQFPVLVLAVEGDPILRLAAHESRPVRAETARLAVDAFVERAAVATTRSPIRIRRPARPRGRTLATAPRRPRPDRRRTSRWTVLWIRPGCPCRVSGSIRPSTGCRAAGRKRSRRPEESPVDRSG